MNTDKLQALQVLARKLKKRQALCDLIHLGTKTMLDSFDNPDLNFKPEERDGKFFVVETGGDKRLEFEVPSAVVMCYVVTCLQFVTNHVAIESCRHYISNPNSPSLDEIALQMESQKQKGQN